VNGAASGTTSEHIWADSPGRGALTAQVLATYGCRFTETQFHIPIHEKDN